MCVCVCLSFKIDFCLSFRNQYANLCASRMFAIWPYHLRLYNENKRDWCYMKSLCKHVNSTSIVLFVYLRFYLTSTRVELLFAQELVNSSWLGIVAGVFERSSGERESVCVSASTIHIIKMVRYWRACAIHHITWERISNGYTNVCVRSWQR